MTSKPTFSIKHFEYLIYQASFDYSFYIDLEYFKIVISCRPMMKSCSAGEQPWAHD